MKIGIIGAGMIGSTAAPLFVHAGHEVAICNSRDPETLAGFVARHGPDMRAMTVTETARFGEVVLLAIPFREYRTVPAGELRGKVVIDAMNYYPSRDGHFPELDRDETTSSEMVAQHLEGARLVKAFNTIYFEHLRRQGDVKKPLDQRRAIFVAGDDAGAKKVVRQLIEELGFGAVDMGSLRDSRTQQPDTPVYNRNVTVDEAAGVVEEEL